MNNLYDHFYKKGMRVRYISHNGDNVYYPPYGTLGTCIREFGRALEVKWDEGTKGDGIWYCRKIHVELVKDDDNDNDNASYEELKHKIAKIIYDSDVCIMDENLKDCSKCKYATDVNSEIPFCNPFRMAEALIAAGIGDVKEAERRIAKAERALVMSCANTVKDEKSDVNIEQVIRALYYKYLKQAEEELEGDDIND